MNDFSFRPKARRNAIAAGILVQVEATVYVVAGSTDTWHRQLRVGLLALGPNAWVSHEAAAALHELEGTPDERPAVFTTMRGRRGVRLRNGTVHTTTLCGPHDVIAVDGFRCASATRVVLDLAAEGASDHRVAQAIDSAVRLRKSAVVVLEKRLAALRGSGRPGVRRLDRLLLDSGGESVLERTFLRLVRENGLPRPKTQCRIPHGPRQVARVDFLYEDERLVIEVSGRLGHSTPSERAKDAQRRNELQDLGFAVYEYTWGDVTTRPRWVVETLRERLARRRAQTLV
jgi:very-short-patch-repair endonuclease